MIFFCKESKSKIYIFFRRGGGGGGGGGLWATVSDFLFTKSPNLKKNRGGGGGVGVGGEKGRGSGAKVSIFFFKKGMQI